MMKKITLIVIACLFGVFYSSVSNAQTVFWTETFTNSCAANCATYTGPNGAWSFVSTGANTNTSNVWYVSEAEGGLGAGQCGAVSNTLSSLHIGANDGIITDVGAAYDNGQPTNWRAQSAVINCTGKYGISIKFNYMMNGLANLDYGSLGYYDGTTWYYYNGLAWLTTISSLPQTATSCSMQQGLWTLYSVALPLSANNNANVKIGFNWTNGNNVAGADPSIAVDSIRILNSSLTGIDNINSDGNSISVYPTPNNGNFTLAYHLSSTNAVFHVMDLTGRIVYTQNVNGMEGTQIIDASALSNGIYYWEIIPANAVPSKGRIAIVK